ncbi:MAG: hypothetical protein F6K26_31230 [Moorea sp. SIO2I5]|nr:hypothetical protein [Moorena sp. SIO2I5]
MNVSQTNLLYRFPIPNSQFPIPDSRFPIPDSRFPYCGCLNRSGDGK